MLRQPADTQLQRIDTIELPKRMHCQNIRKSGSEAAVDNSRYVCSFRGSSFGQLLFDNAVVMTKVAKMAAGFKCSLGKKVIEMKSHRADNDGML